MQAIQLFPSTPTLLHKHHKAIPVTNIPLYNPSQSPNHLTWMPNSYIFPAIHTWKTNQIHPGPQHHLQNPATKTFDPPKLWHFQDRFHQSRMQLIPHLLATLIPGTKCSKKVPRRLEVKGHRLPFSPLPQSRLDRLSQLFFLSAAMYTRVSKYVCID